MSESRHQTPAPDQNNEQAGSASTPGALSGVLHVVTMLTADGRYGGPQTVARTIAAQFGQTVWGGATRIDFDTEAARPNERRFRAFGPTGDHFALLSTPGLWWALLRRRRQCRGCVHVHTGPELIGVVSIVVLIATRAAFIVQTHGMLNYPPASLRRRAVSVFMIPLLRRARAVVALTDVERELLIDYGLSPGCVVVVPNGVPLVERDVRITGSSPNRPTVSFVGRLHPRKHAILASQGVVADYRTAGADQGGLAAARACDPDSVVTHLGSVRPAEAQKVIAGSDVVVMCSDFEPFGMVAIEALALETALVVTSSCDIAVELGAANAATVVEPRPEDIAEGIDRLLSDPGLRERMRSAGRSLVARRYAIDVISDRWAEVYADAANMLPR